MIRHSVLSLALLCFSLASLVQAQVYIVTDLGTLGGTYSVGTGINERGEVVGYADNADETEAHAFLWTRNGGMQDLNPPGIAFSNATGINNSGHVVGLASFPVSDFFQTHAFLWTRAQGMQDLGSLGDYSAAWAVNNRGQVVGDMDVQSNSNVLLWTRHLGIQDLAVGADAKAINDRGWLGGGAFTGGGFHAFLWIKTDGLDLGTLGGDSSEAFGINDIGQVVGSSNLVDDTLPFHAFLWTSRKGMQDLGTPPGTSESMASAINNGSLVVGSAWSSPGTETLAVMWTNGTGWLNLNDLISPDSGWTLQTANAINNRGQITGMGYIDGKLHAYLLTLNHSLQ